MKLIVGIGNVGKEYENTRHNMGFMVIDSYLGKCDYQEKFNAYVCEKNIFGEKVFFIKPTTYVNNSGFSVAKFVSYYNIPLENILVVHDDLDLDSGRYRLKIKSSSGGHNGIKSIINSLNSDNFLRLKIGIKTKYMNDVIDYVLGKLSKEEVNNYKNNEETYIKIVDSFIKDGIEKTMNIYNKK